MWGAIDLLEDPDDKDDLGAVIDKCEYTYQVPYYDVYDTIVSEFELDDNYNESLDEAVKPFVDDNVIGLINKYEHYHLPAEYKAVYVDEATRVDQLGTSSGRDPHDVIKAQITYDTPWGEEYAEKTYRVYDDGKVEEVNESLTEASGKKYKVTGTLRNIWYDDDGNEVDREEWEETHTYTINSSDLPPEDLAKVKFEDGVTKYWNKRVRHDDGSEFEVEVTSVEPLNESLTEDKNDTLNPAIWENDELKPEVKETLEKIANTFLEKLKADDIPLDVEDIIIVGSNRNYNYGPQSDIDLHIIRDLSEFKGREKELAEKLYQRKKSIFNDKYSPTINGFEVEIYVEPSEDKDNNDIPDEVEEPEDSIDEKLVKKGSKWQAQSEKGRNFGTYDTKAEAEERLKQMEMFKHMNEAYRDTDEVSIEELRNLPIGSFIKVKVAGYKDNLVNGENAYVKVDDDVFAVTDEAGNIDDTFNEQATVDVYYSLLDLDPGEYDIVTPGATNESLNEKLSFHLEPLDDEPTFEEFLMNEYGMTQDEVEVEPEVEEYYRSQYDHFLDHLYDLAPVAYDKHSDEEVEFDDLEPEYTEFDNFRDTFGVERDMPDEEVREKILAKHKEWDFDDAEEATDAVMALWDAMKDVKEEPEEEVTEALNEENIRPELRGVKPHKTEDGYELDPRSVEIITNIIYSEMEEYEFDELNDVAIDAYEGDPDAKESVDELFAKYGLPDWALMVFVENWDEDNPKHLAGLYK